MAIIVLLKRCGGGDSTTLPEACATCRAAYKALAEFEADLRRHVRLEDNILFPHARALSSDVNL